MAFADLVLSNGRLYTVEPSQPWAAAMAVRDGRILAVGGEADIADFVGPRTQVVDLGGRMLMPGINDAHNHVFEGARSELFEIQLAPSLGFAGILEAVGRYATLPGRREWITGGVWGPGLLAELQSERARHALDAVSAGRPVVLRDLSFHSRFANSAALAAAGITAATPDPENGIIVRDPVSGRPTGLLHETAGFTMDGCVEPWTAADNAAAALRGIALYHSLGVTAFQLAVASRTSLATFKALDDAGRLPAWVAFYLAMAPGIAQPRDGIGLPLVAERRKWAGPHMGVDFAKFFMDGVPVMRTAAFIDPYLPAAGDEEPFHGQSHYTVSALADAVAALDAEGIAVKVHAVGDRATRDVLDAIEQVRQRNGSGGPLHQIAHMNFIRDADIERLAALGVAADLCPPMWFPSGQLEIIARQIGAERIARSWPIRRMIEAGVTATAGTDWPAVAPSPSPWPGLASMVTRRNPVTRGAERLGPEQAIDLATAIRLYTLNPSRVMRREAETGSLRAGKSADFIVLDRNLFDIPPEEIADTTVLATFFAGRPVFAAAGGPFAAG